jgi:hypothetical protein
MLSIYLLKRQDCFYLCNVLMRQHGHLVSRSTGRLYTSFDASFTSSECIFFILIICSNIGTVSVFPTKPTRTNHIRVIFKGEISSLLKDKENITLFNKVKILPVSKDDEHPGKSHILEAKSHTFPFDFLVPEDIALPSSMEVCEHQYDIKLAIVLSSKYTYFFFVIGRYSNKVESDIP